MSNRSNNNEKIKEEIIKRKVNKNGLSKNIVQCRKHPNGHLVNDQHTGDVICAICGLVVDIVIDTSAEWRQYEDDPYEKSRVGAAENVWLSSAANLATSVSAPQRGENNFGKIVQRHYKRRSVDRACAAGFNAIRIISNRLNLPDAVVNRACDLYSKSYIRNAYKGNVLFCDSKTAACVYIACHLDECPRTSSEICGVSEFSREIINRAAQNIINTLNIKLTKSQTVDFVMRFCGVLNVGKSVKKDAFKLAGKMDAIGRIEHPDCMAAAVIAVSEPNLPESDEQICERLGISLGLFMSYRMRIQYSLQM